MPEVRVETSGERDILEEHFWQRFLAKLRRSRL